MVIIHYNNNHDDDSDYKHHYIIMIALLKGRQAGNGAVMSVQVSPGDGVRFREFAGSQVKLGTDEYIVLRTYDILAKW